MELNEDVAAGQQCTKGPRAKCAGTGRLSVGGSWRLHGGAIC